MTTQFITAMVRLARAVGSTEFSHAKQMLYMTQGASAIAADAPNLRSWVKEVEHLTRLAHADGRIDEREMLILESYVSVIKTELEKIVSAESEYAELDAELDAEDGETGFNDETPDLEELLAIVQEAIESGVEDGDVEDDAFWGIIDANFELSFDDAALVAAYEDAPLEECQCPECSADDDFAAEKTRIDRLAVLLADSVYDLAYEAYLMLNDKFRHPALRNDPTVEAYAREWKETFQKAAGEGSYALADALVKLTDLADDAIFALIAKNSPTLDSFVARSAACIESGRRMLTVV